MYGAMIGDIIGSPFEFDRSNKTKEFTLFSEASTFTDDTVLTIALFEGIKTVSVMDDDHTIKKAIAYSLKTIGRQYPYAGYGSRFFNWLRDETDFTPYGSYGNGSAMRVSSVGWLYDTLEDTRRMARLSAEVTHNHPEGIKGAEATASVMFLARNGHSKEEIKDYISKEFGYDLSRTLDEIRPTYRHIESCQKTVPEAITCFLEGTSYEDVIRNCVSIGGDTDTLGAIAGAMAECYYEIPKEFISSMKLRIPNQFIKSLQEFDGLKKQRVIEN